MSDAQRLDIKRPGLKKLERLLYQEADLLGRADLVNWMEMYTDDGIYWMPVKEDQEDGLNHISIFYDDKTLMDIRARHMTHPRAPSKGVPLRSSYMIGNVQVQEFTQDECVVTSNFHCAVSYNGKQQLYAGWNRHTLVRNGDGWLIKLRRVDLINCDVSHGSIHSYI